MSPLGSLSSSVLPTCIVSSRVFVNAWDGPSPVSMVRKVSLEEPENVQLEVQDRGGRGGAARSPPPEAPARLLRRKKRSPFRLEHITLSRHTAQCFPLTLTTNIAFTSVLPPTTLFTHLASVNYMADLPCHDTRPIWEEGLRPKSHGSSIEDHVALTTPYLAQASQAFPSA